MTSKLTSPIVCCGPLSSTRSNCAMAFLTRIVAVAALFSFAYAGVSGPSAAENYAVAAQRAREHHQRAPLVRAAPDRVRRRGMQRRCKGSTPTTTSTTTTTSSYSTSKTWKPNDVTTSSTSSTTQPPKQTPGNPSSGGKKKAFAWGGSPDELGNFVNGHVGYIYNWRADPPQQDGLQAASMLWGWKNLDGFRQKRSQYPILMGPNECVPLDLLSPHKLIRFNHPGSTLTPRLLCPYLML